ncbi:MAG: hypothetical protein DLM68_07320 [Hyphomicrobiales bacterium]|nr:MAG: hypothetical protein DLM68_07320 [Hyphomicrobiales bacterium]
MPDWTCHERDIDQGLLDRKRVWRWPSVCRSQRRAPERSANTRLLAVFGPAARDVSSQARRRWPVAVGIGARQAKAALDAAPDKTGAIRRRLRRLGLFSAPAGFFREGRGKSFAAMRVHALTGGRVGPEPEGESRFKRAMVLALGPRMPAHSANEPVP